jgi:hypothetical protein
MQVLSYQGVWEAAIASNGGVYTGMLGISLATAASGATNLNVAMPGSIVYNSSWSFSAGQTLYIDPATPGNITSTMPSGTGQAIRVVGYALSASAIYFYPSADYVTHV